MLTLEGLIAVLSLCLTAFGLGYTIGGNQSSRRKFLLMRNFRPLTPPCVPFGTRRFNQLNM